MPDEPIVDPRLRVVDAHHHLGIVIAGGRAPRARRYALRDLEADLASGHLVAGTVHVEAGYWSHGVDGAPRPEAPVQETRRLAGLRSSVPALQGLVAYADLTLGARAADVVDAHVEAGDGRLRGVRQPWARDARPGVPTSPRAPRPGAASRREYVDAVASLGRCGLVFETWCYEHQLAEVADLAEQVPGTTIVVDHLGGPLFLGPHGGDKAAWFRGVGRLAALPHVHVKISGIGFRPFAPAALLERRHSPHDIAAAWRRTVDTVVAAFGPARCLAGTNFPVDALAGDYRTIWSALKLLVADHAAADRHELLAGTAIRVYGLDLDLRRPGDGHPSRGGLS